MRHSAVTRTHSSCLRGLPTGHGGFSRGGVTEQVTPAFGSDSPIGALSSEELTQLGVEGCESPRRELAAGWYTPADPVS